METPDALTAISLWRLTFIAVKQHKERVRTLWQLIEIRKEWKENFQQLAREIVSPLTAAADGRC